MKLFTIIGIIIEVDFLVTVFPPENFFDFMQFSGTAHVMHSILEIAQTTVHCA